MTTVEVAEARLSAVVAHTTAVLLDFDGPVTHLFIDGRNQRVADQLRAVLDEARVTIPDDMRLTFDPLIVLRWAATNTDPAIAAAVEEACLSGEYQCVEESRPTHGAAELLQACQQVGRPVVIVSNNSAGPIRRFLELHQLDHLVNDIVGRTPGHPELMKPHPDSVNQALRRLGEPASECAFIGDTITDIAVAHATGVRSIGYAKNPRRGLELAAANADAIVDDLAQLADMITARGAIRTAY